MTDDARFSDHERKLFRRRVILSPVVAVAVLAGLLPFALNDSGWRYLITAAAVAVLIVTAPGLLVLEQMTNLKRFDPVLSEAGRRAVLRLRGVRNAMRIGIYVLGCLVIFFEPFRAGRPTVVGLTVLAGLYFLTLAWLFRRETAIVRTFAQLTP
jgi:hypothetical protein